MSTDALRAVVRKMKLPLRLDLASLDSELFNLAANFNDADSLLLDDQHVFFAGKEAASESGPVTATPTSHHLPTILAHCRAILRLIIQSQLPVEEVGELEQLTNSVRKLYISNENLQSSTGWADLQFKKLKYLGILKKEQQKISFKLRISAANLKPFLCPSLTQVTLTGMVLLPDSLPALFSLPNLRILDLIGTLIDSKEGGTIIASLTSPPKLKEISLPPSLFSFSKDNLNVKYNFRWLMAAKIAVYVEYFSEESFEHDLSEMFSKEMRQLLLYGNTTRIKNSSKIIKKLKNIEILFGSNDPIYLAPSFAAPNASHLVSHLVRSSPYSRTQRRENRNESWEFTLAAAQDDPPIQQLPQRRLGFIEIAANNLPEDEAAALAVVPAEQRRPANPRIRADRRRRTLARLPLRPPADLLQRALPPPPLANLLEALPPPPTDLRAPAGDLLVAQLPPAPVVAPPPPSVEPLRLQPAVGQPPPAPLELDDNTFLMVFMSFFQLDNPNRQGRGN